MVGEHLLDELGRFGGDAEILQAWRDGMAPEPALLVSEWADRHRVLGSRGSAEPGPWRTSRTPYLREVMDALSPAHPARRVVFMKGAQVGGTECGNNWIGYVIHHASGPMLAVQPTTELAKRFYAELVTGPHPELLEEFVAEDAVDEASGGLGGREDFRAHLAWIAESAGEVTATVTDTVAEGDRVVAFWRIEGTHKGELFGLPATGRPFAGFSVSTLTFRDGKLVHYRVLPDRLGILQQLGALG